MKTLLALLCLILATPALSEPRTLLASSGEWRLYRDAAYEFDWRNGKVLIFNNVCVAETQQVQTTMQILALGAGQAQVDPALAGQLMMRVAKNDWDFSQDRDQLVVSIMDKNHRVKRAFFNGHWITAPMGVWASANNPFSRAAAIWGQEIVFKDRTLDPLTDVRANGLNAIYPALLDCAEG